MGTWRAVFDFFECICYAHCCCCCFYCCCFFSSKTGCCCCYVLGQHVVCVSVCVCVSLSRQRLQNKNILCNSLKAIFRCSFCCCCWVFALFLWYLSLDLNRNLGRISLWQNWRAFDRAQLHLQLLLLEISNWKWKQDFLNNKFTHFRKFQKVGEEERDRERQQQSCVKRSFCHL